MTLKKFVDRMCTIDGAALGCTEKAEAMKQLVREYLCEKRLRPPRRLKRRRG